MTSTGKPSGACEYLGVDITDRYARSPRAIDVCGLESRGKTFIPHFWTWAWPESANERVGVSALIPEVTAARAVLLDGPQGLARSGCTMRACEKALGAAGKTPDVLPPASRPYGGFIRSSIELFEALNTAGLVRRQDALVRIDEVYPAAIWMRFAEGLPHKSGTHGRHARSAILRALGVDVPETPPPNHDRLDACAAALLGAVADGRIPGVSIDAVGEAVYWDEAHKCLREGQIAIPLVCAELHAEIHAVVHQWTLQRVAAPAIVIPAPVRPIAIRGGAAAQRLMLSGDGDERCDQLLGHLVSELMAGRPTLWTYKKGAADILQTPWCDPLGVAHLVRLASRTKTYEIGALGHVRLDTFIVNAKTRRPGAGHWKSATYTEDEWRRIFDDATIVK